MKWLLLLCLFACNAFAASSEHIRMPGVEPAPEIWYPQFPDKSDMDTYCNLWAEKALYGVGAYLKAADGARHKTLVITHQTSAEDKAHPEIFNTVDMDDGQHATVIIVTDGEQHGVKWMLKEEVKRQVEDAMLSGWDWAKANQAKAEMYKSAPMEAWLQFMFQHCKATQK